MVIVPLKLMVIGLGFEVTDVTLQTA